VTDQLSIFDQKPRPLDMLHGDDTTAEERLIIRYLANHRSRDNAAKASVMEQLFNMTNVAVRKTVRHLIDYHGLCIGSSGAGYFMAETPEEVEAVTRRLRHRGISILVRAAKLQKVSVEAVYGQAILELEAQAK
jgi:hypothetical protein